MDIVLLLRIAYYLYFVFFLKKVFVPATRKAFVSANQKLQITVFFSLIKIWFIVI